jgi:DUF2971 family protein
MTAFQSDEAPEPPVPVVLYKYLPPERIDILENMEIRFSPPTEFNDIFDTDYLVPKSEGSKGMATRIKLKRQLGVLCLTERPDDHRMWVHYARNHTGFVLGFNGNASFFNEDERALREVIYLSHPHVLHEAGLNACFYKSEAWKDEHEWRCVRHFEPLVSRMVGIEPSLVTQIIFGHQMDPWQIARIIHWTTEYEMTQTQFLISSPSRSSWTLENNPKRMSRCHNCSGVGYLMEDSKTIGQ